MRLTAPQVLSAERLPTSTTTTLRLQIVLLLDADLLPSRPLSDTITKPAHYYQLQKDTGKPWPALFVAVNSCAFLCALSSHSSRSIGTERRRWAVTCCVCGGEGEWLVVVVVKEAVAGSHFHHSPCHHSTTSSPPITSISLPPCGRLTPGGVLQLAPLTLHLAPSSAPPGAACCQSTWL